MQIPADVQQEQMSHDVYYCAGCNKVYWDGSHVERMRSQLDKWQQEYNLVN
jgi:uncharacterized protein with PIN domain